jgi:hypothetical protein
VGFSGERVVHSGCDLIEQIDSGKLLPMQVEAKLVDTSDEQIVIESAINCIQLFQTG